MASGTYLTIVPRSRLHYGDLLWLLIYRIQCYDFQPRLPSYKSVSQMQEQKPFIQRKRETEAFGIAGRRKFDQLLYTSKHKNW